MKILQKLKLAADLVLGSQGRRARALDRALTGIARGERGGPLASALDELFARYEAGSRFSTRRSYLPGYVRDARFDLDGPTRLEIVRKSRYWERNSGIFNRLCDLTEQYATGRLIPASSDRDWNGRARKWFARWAKYPDLLTRQDFAVLTALIIRSVCVDGEVFCQLTSGKTRMKGQSFPRLTLIETHRVKTPPDMLSDSSVVDGLQLDTDGRVVGYWVEKGGADWFASGTNFDFVGESEMVHFMEPSRTGQIRGLPIAYPVLERLTDLEDLLLLTLDASKEAASVKEWIESGNNEVSADMARRVRYVSDASATHGTAGGSASRRDEYYDQIFRSRAKLLLNGDKLHRDGPNLPSQSQVEHWNWLVNEICVGWGVSKLLVFPQSIQGTVTRADLETTGEFFRARSKSLEAPMSRIYEYVMDWGTRNSVEVSDPPEDWRDCKFIPPRSVNVDVGRNATALVAEYLAGWRTLESICGELGDDWRDVLEQRAVERAQAREYERQYGLREGELIQATLEAIKADPKASGQPATTTN